MSYACVQGEPRTGAFEVVVKQPGTPDVLVWSKLQLGEPSNGQPETLKAVSDAIISEIKTLLRKEEAK